jgi:hypothetical protein
LSRGWVYSTKFDPIEPLRVVFGPENKLNGQNVWTITSYSTNVHSLKSVLNKVSQVQGGEVVKLKKVKISGASGTIVTVSSKGSTKKKVVSVVVSGESMGRSDVIYVLSNGGLGEKGFESFYKSFYIVPTLSDATKNKNSITKIASSSSTGEKEAKSSTQSNGSPLGLYLENLSSSRERFKDGMIAASYVDFIGVGWTNTKVHNCEIVNPNKNFEIQDRYKNYFETNASIVIELRHATPAVYTVTVMCKTAAGKKITETAKINYLRGLELQMGVTNNAIKTNGPSPEWYAQTLKPSETKNLATLNVAHLYDIVYELSGKLNPPSNCSQGYITYYKIEDGNGLYWMLQPPSCQPVTYSVRFTYQPGYHSPAISLVTYNGKAIEHYEQSRRNIVIDAKGSVTYR